ncbi:hypothetical protein [Longitalea luteola]|uniref:hypothetical protein n=1 Tax=Longitalea luteola TaxID=2812563 RepID=UPI001A96012D|nr:hypothetical protein [Longitalea luteola]
MFIRKTAVFYLLLLVLLKVLAAPVIYLQFEWNKAYIAANLCENRNKPIMSCGGKCHLNKQLSKATETSDPQTQKGNTTVVLLDYCESIKEFLFDPDLSLSQPFETWLLTNTAKGHSGNVFHPPIA